MDFSPAFRVLMASKKWYPSSLFIYSQKLSGTGAKTSNCWLTSNSRKLFFLKPLSFLTNPTHPELTRVIYPTGSGPNLWLVLDSVFLSGRRASPIYHLHWSALMTDGRCGWGVGTDCPRHSSASQACSDGAGCVWFSGSTRIFDITLPSGKQECRQQRNSLADKCLLQ